MKKKIFFVITLILLFFVIIFESRVYNVCYLDNIITDKELDKVLKSKKETGNIIDIYYYESKIPYVKDSNYYLFYIDNQIDFKDIYVNNGKKIKIIEELDNGLKVIIYDNNHYKISNIIFTTIPVVNLTTDSKNDNKHYGNITLFGDINYDNEIANSNCRFHVRGSSSKTWTDNHSYKLNLLGRNNKNLSMSLLGMSSDNDWILNSMWMDNSYMRDKLGFYIWNNLNEEYQQNMQYVELVIDNEYKGLFLLEEEVDMDSFDANKNDDLLISTKYWQNEIKDRKIYDENYEFDKRIDEFEIEAGNPDKTLQRNLIISMLDGVFDDNKGSIVLNYNIENNATYTLFINMIQAMDNRYKNEKILFRKNGSEYDLYIMPWDLDWSFGNPLTGHETNISKMYDNDVVPKNISSSDEFKKVIKDKYLEASKKFYNYEDISKIIDEYADYIRSSGALIRMNKEEEFEVDIINIKKYLKNRIDYLDSYYGG